MGITIEFSDFEDMRTSVLKMAELFRREQPVPAVVTTPALVKAEPEEAKAEPEAVKAEQEITEDFRVEVRKVLAQLKKRGNDVPKGLIREIGGAERLPDVPLEKLPALMEKAKEVLNAG